MNTRNGCWWLAAALAATLCMAGDGVAAQDKYTTRYDNIDIENILKSERLLNSYVNCIMTGNGCTPEGKLLRELLPDAIETECVKCSEVQKKQAGRVLSYLLQYKRPVFDKLVNKFDPEGKFRKKYDLLDDDEEYDEQD